MRSDGSAVDASTTHGDHDAAASSRAGFSEVEECLWLRVFGAVEGHAAPCRTEPRQGPTPPHLVPLDKAVAAIGEIFGGEKSPAPTTSPRTSKNTGGGR